VNTPTKTRAPRRTPLAALAVAAFIGLAAVLGSAPPTSAIENAPSFDVLWSEAVRWAREAGAEPEDCVFSLRFDPKSKVLRSGYAATCDEPYRSPFYPWPAPSRPGARFTVDDIRSYGARVWAESGRPLRFGGVSVDEQLLETCGLIVGFTKEGRGAEAIECYWIQGSVMGHRANTGFVVDTADGRRLTSRLDDRIAHLGEREVKGMLTRLHRRRALSADGGKQVTVRVVGRVVSRGLNRLVVWGRALPLVGESQAAPGVVTTDANLVVHYPSDDALGLDRYLEGTHCFKEKRERAEGQGVAGPEWVYGPCDLRTDQYWMFEHYPLGRPTMVHGPYRDYGECDRDRKKLKATSPGVAGHCAAKTKVALRMLRDGALVVPTGAPPLE
jgi:hypothetical protein